MSLRHFLRRREQREIAEMQDIIVSLIYRVLDPPPILHGGTVIWRVYKSPRFSEDVDAYHVRVGDFRDALEGELDSLGMRMLKYRETANAVYIVVGDRRRVRLEFSKRPWNFRVVEAEYEQVDGGFMLIKTLAPEHLLKEKVQAYLERRKARDLFDIYYLLNFVDVGRVREDLRKLVGKLSEPPPDWSELRVLILRGAPPAFNTVRGKILRMLR
ncbi:MAG: hypothetical protein DRJ32_06460 [Thermoprotei archaeon]|nr:MAG: hypothetical protein DRJ32_06460 [Thermoprotei archaeon]